MAEGQTEMLMVEELFGDSLIEDPYPSYRRFLDAGPIHYANYRGGAWAILSRWFLCLQPRTGMRHSFESRTAWT
jgi:hypothetical protein